MFRSRLHKDYMFFFTYIKKVAIFLFELVGQTRKGWGEGEVKEILKNRLIVML